VHKFARVRIPLPVNGLLFSWFGFLLLSFHGLRIKEYGQCLHFQSLLFTRGFKLKTLSDFRDPFAVQMYLPL